MAKNLRRNCDNPTCGKQYRHQSAASKYCGRGCKDKVGRVRKAEREKAAREAEMNGWMAGVRERQVATQRATQIEPQIEPPNKPPTAAASKPADECGCIGRDFGHLPDCHLNTDPTRKQARPSVKITIRNVPTRFPGTPLPRVR